MVWVDVEVLESLVLLHKVHQFLVVDSKTYDRHEGQRVGVHNEALGVEVEGDSMIRGTLNGQLLGGSYGVITISPLGSQPPAGLSAARGLAALRAYLVVSVTID
jgi:hypothetical protein